MALAGSQQAEAEKMQEEVKFFRCEYFATTSDLLKAVIKTTTPSRWTGMHRTSTKKNPVAINVRRKSTDRAPLDPYTITRDAMEAENDGVASGLSTRTESDESTTTKIAI